MMILIEITNSITKKIKRLAFGPEKWITNQVSKNKYSIERLGTRYGGWEVLSDEPELENTYAVLCGAGEDVSFDLALQKQHRCNIIIIDPTPRAITHYQNLLEAAEKEKPYPINSSTSEFYDLSGVDFQAIKFVPVAIWHENATLKFWKPRNKKFVSHSATNIQNTDQYIEVAAMDLAAIASEQSITLDEISILKLDVEGAEGVVLEWCFENDFKPKQLLIEFDELNFPSKKSGKKIISTIKKLLVSYELAMFDGRSNCLFVRRN